MEGSNQKRARYQNVGLVLGPVLAALVFIFSPPEGLSPDAWRVVGMGLLMASWWATEAIPVPATSLIPLVWLPLLGIVPIGEAAPPYASPIIFLLLGGFIIAMAMRRWELHRRIALNILSAFHGGPASLIGGFMVATAALSMWISNTATTLMMIPIALSVAEAVTGNAKKNPTFVVALLLGVAYAASIGGFGTLVGTPPNAMAAAFLKQSRDIDISFVQWMGLGVPIVLAVLPLAWLVLTRIAFPLKGLKSAAGRAHIERELQALGPITVPERRTAYVFALVAFCWVFRPVLNQLPLLESLNDTMIAIGGAILMFLVPAGSRKKPHAFLLNWTWAEKLPWGVLLLFGGGLSLARAIDVTGLSVWLGEGLSALTIFPLLFLVMAIVALVVFLTELTSNTATTATLLPILGALALSANGMDPILLEAPAAIAASCAFMLPVATAPNAIVFATGHIHIPQMVKAGFWLNILAILTISTMGYLLVPLVFG